MWNRTREQGWFPVRRVAPHAFQKSPDESLDHRAGRQAYTMTSHLLMPKMGPLEVGTYLATYGHDVSVYVECMNGLDESGILQSDIIGFSVGVGNATRVYDMVARLKPQSRATFVAGGPHATMVPDEALHHGFDYVVRAEGEETCRELLETLEENGEVGAVLGVSYLHDGAPMHNAPRPFMKSFELTPSYSLLKGFRRKGALEQARLGKVYRELRADHARLSLSMRFLLREQDWRHRISEADHRIDRRRHPLQDRFPCTNESTSPTRTLASTRSLRRRSSTRSSMRRFAHDSRR